MLDLNDVIVLDTGSSFSGTFMNTKFVEDIKSTTQPVTLMSNAGYRKVTKEGNVPGFGKAYYHPNFIANILGFSHVKDKYRVAYDSDIDDAFYVFIKPNDPIRFVRNNKGLYVYYPPPNFKQKMLQDGVTMIQQVAENMKKYTKREQSDAFRARRLYRTMGFPTQEEFKALVRQGSGSK